MKKLGILLLVLVPGGLVLYFAYKMLFGKVDDKGKQEITQKIWDENSCVPEGDRYWRRYIYNSTVRNEVNKNLEAIGLKYFQDKSSQKDAIHGFFKGADLFPSVASAKYFENYFLAWMDHPKGGLPVDVIQLGELKCKKPWEEEDFQGIPNAGEIADQVGDALKDVDWSTFPTAEEIRANLENLPSNI